ncbi:hypothetical protein EDD86DRAFT_206149 [Gorgonomyces haynaldii]|nr:hypothetical protein EDD86DRAFT_206149 [Gorgonomyces haynaldii]
MTGDDYGGFGGFQTEEQQGGYMQTSTPNSKKQSQSLRFVTVGQINNALVSGDNVSIDDVPVTTVCVVARANKIVSNSTNVQYTLDDGTGMIEAKHFIADSSVQEEIPEGTYVKVFGNVKVSKERKVFTAFKVSQVHSVNTLSLHLLQVMRSKVVLSQPKSGSKPQDELSNPIQQQIMAFFNQYRDTAKGGSIEQLCQTLRAVASEATIQYLV